MGGGGFCRTSLKWVIYCTGARFPVKVTKIRFWDRVIYLVILRFSLLDRIIYWVMLQFHSLIFAGSLLGTPRGFGGALGGTFGALVEPCGHPWGTYGQPWCPRGCLLKTPGAPWSALSGLLEHRVLQRVFWGCFQALKA